MSAKPEKKVLRSLTELGAPEPKKAEPSAPKSKPKVKPASKPAETKVVPIVEPEAPVEEVPVTNDAAGSVPTAEPIIEPLEVISLPAGDVVTVTAGEDLEQGDPVVLVPQENGEGHIALSTATVAAAAEREQLIKDLLEYDTSGKGQELQQVYNNLSDVQLRDMLDLLRAEWGGSPKFRLELQEIEKMMKAYADSPATRARISLLRTKYKEYHQLATKVEKALGTDTVVKTMKHTEYHKTLEALLKQFGILVGSIREMADMVALQLPAIDTNGSQNLSPDNVAELVRVCLMIGTSAKSWLLTADTQRKQNMMLRDTNDKLVEQVKTLNSSLQAERERYAAREDELRRKTHQKFGERFAVVNGEGHFVALVEDYDGSGVNPTKLEIVDSMERALLLRSEEQVRRLFDKLRHWSKPKSIYFKKMTRKGLRPEYLDVVRVTLTKI